MFVHRRQNRTGHLTGSWSSSSPSVSGSPKLCHCADKHPSAMFGHPYNKPAHSYSPTPPGWIKGAKANKMPLLSSNPPSSIQIHSSVFSLFNLIFLSRGKRQEAGEEPGLGCWGAETCQALESSAERWDFRAGMLGLWLSLKKTGNTAGR